MKILVTGADGFIGSHLTEMLVESGQSVRAFVYYNSFNSWGWLDTLDKHVLDQIEIFAGDIRDPNGVRQAVKNGEAGFKKSVSFIFFLHDKKRHGEYWGYREAD